MMIDLVDSRRRSNSYEHSSHIPSSRMTAPEMPKNGGSLTPDRSSLLHTSNTPHHRTNFPLPYKPPVAPGYEPPSPRNCVTEAHAASMRGPIHALSVISDIPFDQEEDRQKDDDSDSQPGRIKPATNFPPKPVVSRTATLLHDAKPIVSPPTTGRSSSPMDATTYVGGTGGLKISASYESRSPSPMAPPPIRSTASYRSNSPVLMIGSHSPARQQHQKAHNDAATSQMNSTPRVVSSLPLDDLNAGVSGRVTPSPTMLVQREMMMSNYRNPSPLRNHSPLTTTLMTPSTSAMDEPPSLSGGYRMSPPRVSVPLPRPYTDTVEDEPSALTGDFSLEKPRLVAQLANNASLTLKAPEPQILMKTSEGKITNSKGINNDTSYTDETTTDVDEDEDSLFDFEERNKRKEKNLSEESDDVSQDDEPQNELEQRAQAAWAQHRRVAPVSTAIAPTNKVESTGQSFGVKFGKDDIVHNYDPNSGDADETFDNTTLGGHSLNSLYTKSAESEVEDIIKDIFLIGSGEATNPGRRKFKYKAGIKEDVKLQSRDEEGEGNDEDLHYTDDDDGDAGTYEDTTTFTDTTGLDTGFDTKTNDDSTNRDSSFLVSSVDEPQQKKKSMKATKPKTFDTVEEEEKKEDDPLTDAWAFVESKINEVGAALGLDTSQPNTSNSKSAITSNADTSSKSISSKDGFHGWDFWNYILGPAESLNENPTDEGTASLEQETGVSQSQSLEEDSRFIDLAIQAAISIHRIKGYEYNIDNEMDVINDVRFSVVDLTLPLGVIFQENEKGCWVNQILPEGSAAASRGGVKVGDQLAAVDGLSAIDMTVDEIAKLIRVKKAAVELTFVRYIGPLRPVTTQEEGYEVTATPPRKKLTWSHPATPPTPPPPPPMNLKEQVSPPNSPRGILKKNKKKEEPVAVPNNVAPSSLGAKDATLSKKNDSAKGKEEPKKRFRLFGRRK